MWNDTSEMRLTIDSIFLNKNVKLTSAGGLGMSSVIIMRFIALPISACFCMESNVHKLV